MATLGPYLGESFSSYAVAVLLAGLGGVIFGRGLDQASDRDLSWLPFTLGLGAALYVG